VPKRFDFKASTMKPTKVTRGGEVKIIDSKIFPVTPISAAIVTLKPGGLRELHLISLNVNGQSRRADVMKQETLAWTLRYKLGLTGTKLGCDRAECGACTVLLDDVPHYSCSVLTHTVRDRKVLTIEGSGECGRNAASGPAGHHRGTGIPVRLLYVGLRHGHGGIPENKSRTPPERNWRTAFRETCAAARTTTRSSPR
jgi:hypothetical protein